MTQGSFHVTGRSAFGRAVACLGHPAGGSIGFPNVYQVTPDGTTDGFVDGNSAAERTVYEELGGFDESTFRAADAEMRHRLRAAGIRLTFVPEATAYHPSREKWGDFFWWQLRMGRGRGQVKAKHGIGKSLMWWRIGNVMRGAWRQRIPHLVLPVLLSSYLLQAIGQFMESHHVGGHPTEN